MTSRTPSRKDSLSVTFSLLALTLLGTVAMRQMSVEALSVVPTHLTSNVSSASANAREQIRLQRESRRQKLLRSAVKSAAPVSSEAYRPSARLIRQQVSSRPNTTQLNLPTATPKKAGCGDGIVIAPETCDDENKKDGDGCSSVCGIESGFDCNKYTQPSVCVERCGNGGISARETCDDGNVMNGDGCNQYCHLEPGFNCYGIPTTCIARPICGNSIIDVNETCDDGNTQDGDGCASSCGVETSSSSSESS